MHSRSLFEVAPRRWVWAMSVGVAMLVAGCSALTDLAVGTTTTTASPTAPPGTVVGVPGSGVPSTPVPPSTVAPTLPPPPPSGSVVDPLAGSYPPPPTSGDPLALNTILRPDDGTVVLATADLCSASTALYVGFTMDECVAAPGSPLAAASFHDVDDGAWRVVVFASDPATGGLVSRFVAKEPEPGTWADVLLVLADLETPPNGSPELWVGYRRAGTGQFLDLDLLDPRPGGITIRGALKDLGKGLVDLHPGGATVFAAEWSDTDPTCCPAKTKRSEIGFNGVNWIVGAPELLATIDAELPVGDF